MSKKPMNILRRKFISKISIFKTHVHADKYPNMF